MTDDSRVRFRSTVAGAVARITEAKATPRKKVEALAGDRSFDEIRALVTDALDDEVGQPDSYCCVWIRDLSDEWVAYSVGDETFKRPYSVDVAGVVSFGDPVEVEARVMYAPAPDDSAGGGAGMEPMKASESRDRIHGRVLEAKGTDGAGGRVFGVQIIAYGDSKNGRRYPEAVMKAAAGKYEGAKAYDHHRSDAELESSTIAGLVGTFTDVSADSDGLQADLHLLPSATHAAEALDASLAAQGKGLAPLVGISHDVMARYSPLVEGGMRIQEATEIVSVNSADVVADPAAGGRATRMVAGGTGDPNKEGTDMTLKELLALLRGATAEKRVELLTEHKALVSEWGLDDKAFDRILAETPPPEPTPEPTPEPEPEPVTAGVGATESRVTRTSMMGGMLIREAVGRVGLGERFVETITKRLPAAFTEAELTNAVEGYRDMRVELEQQALISDPRIIGHVTVTKEALDAKRAKLDHMLDAQYHGAEAYRSLKQAFIDISGHNPRADDTEDFNRLIMRESLGDGGFDSGVRRGVESATTGTWNLILGDSITRRLVAEYEQPNLQTWRPIVSSIVPINDFRTQRIDRLGGYGVLPAVNQGAPYQPLTTPGNEEATYAITKRGGTEDLTLETIANDDLRAVQRIPKRLGLAAAQTLYRFVWDMIQTNAVYTPDSTSLFAAGHNNTAATALSNSNLNAARKAMRKQAAYGDTYDVLSLVPKYLVVPPDLEHLAWQLCTSAVAIPTAAPDGAAANQPNIHQGMVPIIVDYWSALTTTAWFIIADPNTAPTIEIGFYQGREDPELFIQNDPTVGSVYTADKVTYKIRHIYSGTPLEFRAMYRGNS